MGVPGNHRFFVNGKRAARGISEGDEEMKEKGSKSTSGYLNLYKGSRNPSHISAGGDGFEADLKRQ
jgi:hypothetical protein